MIVCSDPSVLSLNVAKRVPSYLFFHGRFHLLFQQKDSHENLQSSVILSEHKRTAKHMIHKEKETGAGGGKQAYAPVPKDVIVTCQDKNCSWSLMNGLLLVTVGRGQKPSLQSGC